MHHEPAAGINAMKKLFLYIFCGALMWPQMALLQAAEGARSTPLAQPGLMTLNFINADLEGVIKAVGEAVGVNILVDPRVKGTLSLASDKPVTGPEALDLLGASLRMQGFSLVKSDGLYRVVPEADAKMLGGAVSEDADGLGRRSTSVAGGSQVVTRVFHLRYESANNLLPVLRPLIAPNNPITAYPANNTLVVTDYAENLGRIAKLIDSLDVPQVGEAEVIPLHHALAIDLASLVNHVADPGGGDPNLKALALAEPRTNSLILRAPTLTRLQQLHSLIDKLDAPTAQPGNIWVVPLRNAEAVKLAKTLRGIVTADGAGLTTPPGETAFSSMGSPFAGNAAGSASGSSGTTGSSSGSGSPSSSSGATGFGAGAGSGTSGGSGVGGAGGGAATASAGGAGGSLPAGMIQADVATNSLIITANERVYRNLREVIDRLDARRPQIYVESMIVEVSSNKTEEFGTQLQGLLGGGSTQGFAGTSFNATNPGANIVSLGSQTSSLLNLGAGATPPLVTPAAGTNLAVLHSFNGVMGMAALVRAVSLISGVNVLSTPNLLTLDNETAQIIIAENVPFVTGSYAQTGITGTVNPFTTVDRKDIGLILRIRPQISEGGLVKMQIYEESSALDATTLNNINGPSYTKRSVDSSVLVHDGQLIVLGGLLSDNYSDSMEKTPWLAEIPYLGVLFRYESKARVKDNLMLFLRPYVIRTAEQSDALTNDRYGWTQEMRDGEPRNVRILSNESLMPLTPAQGSGAPFVDPLHTSPLPTATPLPGGDSSAVPAPAGMP